MSPPAVGNRTLPRGPPRNPLQGDVPYAGPAINLYAQLPTVSGLTAFARYVSRSLCWVTVHSYFQPFTAPADKPLTIPR